MEVLRLSGIFDGHFRFAYYTSSSENAAVLMAEHDLSQLDEQ